MESFSKGVYNNKSYNEYEERRMTSLRVCFIGWLFDLFIITVSGISMIVKKLGGQYFYPFGEFFVVGSRFIGVPFIHLLNDEDTKNVIITEGWTQGIMHSLGYYKNQHQ